MANNLLKCLHSQHRRTIANGEYTNTSVSVYYGFDTYNRSADHVLKLIDTVRNEFPEMPMTDIEFYEISRTQSDRHAHLTMARVGVSTEYVREHINEYDIL